MNEEVTKEVKEADISATEAPKSAENATTPKRKKAKRSVPSGQVHILATFNNTIISVTDPSGAVLSNSSAGACGFRGSKKGTAYAAQIASEKAIQAAKQQFGLSRANIFVKGIGLGRDSAIRSISNLD